MRTLYFNKTTGVAMDIVDVDAAVASGLADNVYSTTHYDTSARGWVYNPDTGNVQKVLDGEGQYYVTPEGRRSLHQAAGQPLLCDYFDTIEKVDGTWRVYQEPVNQKLVGVDVGGVMVSATKDDQNGLTAVFLDYISSPASFVDTNFKFQNGSEYLLTKDNILAFKTSWTAFRRSFF